MVPDGDLCEHDQGIFCPSLGAEFRTHSQSKTAIFFPNTMSDFPIKKMKKNVRFFFSFFFKETTTDVTYQNDT